MSTPRALLADSAKGMIFDMVRPFITSPNGPPGEVLFTFQDAEQYQFQDAEDFSFEF